MRNSKCYSTLIRPKKKPILNIPNYRMTATCLDFTALGDSMWGGFWKMRLSTFLVVLGPLGKGHA